MKRIYKMLLICGLSVMTAQAQDAVVVAAADEQMEKAVGLMQEENWSGAHSILQALNGKYENIEKGVALFGTRYGSLFYNKGMCELRMAQIWRKTGYQLPNDDHLKKADGFSRQAIESFDSCYEIQNTETDGGNIYRVKALLFKGNAQQGLGEFDQAILTYEKFLFEKNDIRDQFNLGDLSINLAICHWLKKEPDFKLAEKTFLRGLRLRGQKAPSLFSVITGMRAMLDASEKAGEADRVGQFIKAHHALIKVRLADAVEYLPRYSQLIMMAANMGLLETSQILASRIPDVSTLDETVKNAGAVKKAIAEAQEYALAAKAVGNERLKNLKEAVVDYSLLIETYPNSEHKADYLYNVSRILVLSGEVKRAYEVGRVYLTEFPAHQYTSELKRTLLMALYAAQRYELCTALDDEQLLNLDQLNEPKQLAGDCVFALGAAYYYEGRFTKARPWIERHYSQYAESEFRNESRYLRASVYGHLMQWEKALELLDEYIASVDDKNVYKPHALYDKAFVLYSKEEYDASLVVLKKFIGRYNESLVKAPAHILSGNIYLLKKQRDDAETEYKRAIATAQYTKNKDAEDEAYYLVITMLGKKMWNGGLNEKVIDSLAYFDAYMAGEPMKDRVSRFYTQIVANAMFALTQSGRKDEAFKLLQKALFKYNTKPNTPGTEGAMQNYLITLRNANVKDEDAITDVESSPFLTGSNYHQGLLKVVKLDVLERSQGRAPNAERAKRIDLLYKELFSDFEIKDLDNFALVRAARHLEKYTGLEGEAKKFYQGVIASGSKIKLPEAQVGLLTLLAKSENSDDVKQAEKQIYAIIDNPFTDVNAKAAAHYLLLESLYTQEKWETLTKETITYLQYPTSAKKQVRRAEMLLAVSYDKRDLKEKAIGSYTAVWVNSMFNLDQSAPAMNRAVTLIWERNNPAKPNVQDGKSDKQVAYESAFKYIKKTSKIFDEKVAHLTPEAEKAWRSLSDKIETYGTDPEVKKF